MRRPQIKPIKGSDELVALVYLPLDAAQGFVDGIRGLAKDKGVRIK